MTGIGLAIPASSAEDHFVAALVHALAEPVIAHGMGLFTRVVHDAASEERIYRHWAESEGIAGVALLDAGPADDRVRLLRQLDLPFAAVVDAAHAVDYPAVVVDVAASVDVVAAFLMGSRHQRALAIVGPADSATTRTRVAAVADRFEVVSTDGSTRSVVDAATAAAGQGPVTLLFDSDTHAAAATAAFLSQGLRVPDDVAVVSWTDSSLCQSASPSLTAVNRRGSEIGTLLGRRMLATVHGEANGADQAPHPFVVGRESA